MIQYRTILLAVVCWLCVAGFVIGAEAPPFADAVPVDGGPFKAQVQSISVDGMASWKLPSGETKPLALADLCWWGNWAEPRGQTQVVLIDGSLIVADVTGLDKEQLAIDWSLGGEFQLPLEWIGGIVLAPSVDRQQADLLRARLAGERLRKAPPRTRPDKGNSERVGDNDVQRSPASTERATDEQTTADADRLLLMNGDELSGEITGLDENAVKIRTSAGEVSVGKEKIAAVAFNPSLAAKPKPQEARLWIGFKDGSSVLAAAITADHGQAKIKLPAGPELIVPLTKLVAIQPLAGRTTYLLDLKPAGYQHIPFLDLAWPYQTDRNVLGSRLRGGGQLYLKGLGMHSAARLTYDLDKPYRAFAADAAIDDQTAGRGSALFRVYTDDGSGKWQLQYESPIVRGGAASQAITVDLKGAKRLSLLVDFADHGDEQAHADWLNARLLP